MERFSDDELLASTEHAAVGQGDSEPQHCAVGCVPICTVCGRRKKPVGRDSMDNGLCDYDCEGYMQEPTPCDLWPDEVRDGD